MLDTPVVSPATEVILSPVSVGFIHDREFPADWTAELRTVSPVSEEAGWLHGTWEAGDPWVPGQRWALYEMLHPKFVDDDVMEELTGPHPRSEGHICTTIPTHSWATRAPSNYRPCLCRRKTESWRRGPCLLITLTQWKLYRETGYYGVPFWIIQGAKGGHKWQFNENEQLLLRQQDLPAEPPRLGSLAYAPFDQRVMRQIIRHNRLIQLGASLGEYRRLMGPGYDAYKETLAKQMRAEYVGYLEEQLADVNDLFIRAAKKGDMDGEERTEVNWEKVEEASTAAFVETGHHLHPTMVT
jgi:hypothetical protein